ncbi:MAG: O-antigen ligase family protein [Anaerolineae bacterium]|nr:O-antigen ligase family protein [Anaerolineae bacterium]
MKLFIEPLLICIFIAGVFFFFVRPKYTLYLLIASVPLEMLSTNEMFTLPKLLGLGAFVSFLLMIMFEKQKLIIDKATLVMTLFLIWGCISSFWSSHPQDSLVRIFSLLQLLILYFLIINQIRTPKDFDTVMLFQFIGAIIFSVFGIGDLISSTTGSRLSSIAQNPNLYFVISISLLPSIIWVLISTKIKVVKIIAILVLSGLLITSINTQSRGGLISLGVFFLFYLSLTRKKFSWIMLILIIGISVYWIAPVDFLSRFSIIGNDYLDRFRDIWPAGWRAFTDRIWLGYGIGVSEKILPQYLQFTRRTFQTLSAHNSILAIGIEMGIPGIILYLFFITIPTYRLFHTIKKFNEDNDELHLLMASKILLSVVFAYLVSWIKTGGMEYGKMLWILVGLESVLFNMISATENLSTNGITTAFEKKQVSAQKC